MNELENIVNSLMQEGASDQEIQDVIAEYEKQNAAQPEPVVPELEEGLEGPKQEAFHEETPEQANTLAKLERERNVEETGFALPSLISQEELNERANVKHNEQQKIAAQTIAGVTGIPEEVISPLANFASTTIDLIGSATSKAAESGTYAVMEPILSIFDPDLVDTPEKKEALMRVIKQQGGSGDWDEATGAFDPFKKRYDKGLSDSFAAGDYASAASQTADQVAGAIPSVLASMTGAGGLAAIGASSFGGKFEEDFAANPSESTSKLLAASLASAGYEMASEYVTHKLLAGAGLAFKAGGKQGVKTFIDKATQSIVGGILTEGGSEAAAGIATELTDSFVYDKPVEPGMWTRALDTAIIGGLVGGGVTSIGKLNGPAKSYANERVKPASTQEADKANADKINEAQAVKNEIAKEPDSPNKAKQNSLMDDIIEDNKNELKERQKKHEKVSNELEPEEIEAIVEAKAKLDAADRVLNDPDAKPSAKDLAYEQKQEATRKIDEMYVKPIVQKEIELKVDEKNETHQEKLRQNKNKLAKLEADKKAHDSAPEPNPAFTEKYKVEKQALKEEAKSIRSTISNNKKLIEKFRGKNSKPVQEIADVVADIKYRQSLGEEIKQSEFNKVDQLINDAKGALKGGLIESLQSGDVRKKAEALESVEDASLVDIVKSRKTNGAQKELAYNKLKKDNSKKLSLLENAVTQDFINNKTFSNSPIPIKEIKSEVAAWFDDHINKYDPSKGKSFKGYLPPIGSFDKASGQWVKLNPATKNIIKRVRDRGKVITPPQKEHKVNVTPEIAAEQSSLQELYDTYKDKDIEFAQKAVKSAGFFVNNKGIVKPQSNALFQSKIDDLTDNDQDPYDVLDSSYTEEDWSPITQQAVKKALKLSDNNIDVLKSKLVDAFNTPGAPSPVEGVKFRKFMQKAAGKPVLAQINNVLGKGNKYITNNTDEIYKALPNYARRGDVFGGIFAEGNPKPEAWADYFNTPKRLRALKKALVNNTIDNFLDDALEDAQQVDFKIKAGKKPSDRNSYEKNLRLATARVDFLQEQVAAREVDNRYTWDDKFIDQTRKWRDEIDELDYKYPEIFGRSEFDLKVEEPTYQSFEVKEPTIDSKWVTDMVNEQVDLELVKEDIAGMIEEESFTESDAGSIYEALTVNNVDPATATDAQLKTAAEQVYREWYESGWNYDFQGDPEYDISDTYADNVQGGDGIAYDAWSEGVSARWEATMESIEEAGKYAVQQAVDNNLPSYVTDVDSFKDWANDTFVHLIPDSDTGFERGATIFNEAINKVDPDSIVDNRSANEVFDENARDYEIFSNTITPDEDIDQRNKDRGTYEQLEAEVGVYTNNNALDTLANSVMDQNVNPQEFFSTEHGTYGEFFTGTVLDEMLKGMDRTLVDAKTEGLSGVIGLEAAYKVRNAVAKRVSEKLKEASKDIEGLDLDFKVNSVLPPNGGDSFNTDGRINSNFNSVVAKTLQKAWPNILVTNDAKIKDEVLSGRGVKGIVHGFKTTYKGKDVVYIDKHAAKDTGIHEFGHVWLQSVKQKNPKLWNKGAEIIQNTRYWDYVSNHETYGKYGKDKMLEEAMAEAIGQRGTEIFEELNNTPAWKKWLKDMWKQVGDIVGFEVDPSMTLTDFVEVATADIMKGSDIKRSAAPTGIGRRGKDGKFIFDGKILTNKETEQLYGTPEKFKAAGAVWAKNPVDSKVIVSPRTIGREVETLIKQKFNKITQGKPLWVVVGKHGAEAQKAYGRFLKTDPSTGKPYQDAKVEAIKTAAAKYGIPVTTHPSNSGVLRIGINDHTGQSIMSSPITAKKADTFWSDVANLDETFNDVEVTKELLADDISELVDLNQDVFTLADQITIKEALGLPVEGKPAPIDLKVMPKDIVKGKLSKEKAVEAANEIINWTESLPDELQHLAYDTSVEPTDADNSTVKKKDRGVEHFDAIGDAFTALFRALPPAGQKALAKQYKSSIRIDKDGWFERGGLQVDHLVRLANRLGNPILAESIDAGIELDEESAAYKKGLARKLKSKLSEIENAPDPEAAREAAIEKYRAFKAQEVKYHNRVDKLMEIATKGKTPPTDGFDIDWSKLTGKGGEYTNNQRKFIKTFAKVMGRQITEGKLTMPQAMEFGQMFSGAGNVAFRAAAPLKYQSKHLANSKKTHEHIQPVSTMWARSVQAALTPETFDAEFNKIMSNYFVLNVSAISDNAVNKHYKTTSPANLDSSWFEGKIPEVMVRYFNDRVFLNPFNIVEIATGETIADKLGLDPALEALFPKAEGAGPDGADLMLKVVKNDNPIPSDDVINKLHNNRDKKIKLIKRALGKNYTNKIEPEAAQLLANTKADFEAMSDQLSVDQMNTLLAKTRDVIDNGIASQAVKQNKINRDKSDTERGVADLLTTVSGIEGDLNVNAVKRLAKEQDSWKNLWKGSLGETVASVLAPASNNDFYGLIHDLLPKDGNRDRARKILSKYITYPLENANVEYLRTKREMLDNWKGLREDHNISKDKLSELTDIEVEGSKLSNSQVIRIYNHLKDPSRHKSMADSGVDTGVVNQIVDYIKGSDLKAFADAVPSIFLGATSDINSKMDSQGIKVKPSEKLDVSKLNPDQAQLLNKIFDGNIPATAPYTPGGETLSSLDIKNPYQSMVESLEGKTKGGEYKVFGTDLNSDVVGYAGASGPLRKAAFLGFANNLKGMMSKQNLAKMEASFGTEWVSSFQNSTERILSGSNRKLGISKGESAALDWLNGSIASVMFWNTRSALLQLISTSNYMIENPKAYIKAIRQVRGDSKLKKEIANDIRNSPWFRDRAEGGSELEFDEIFGQEKKTKAGKALSKIQREGYRLTKWGDRTAIAWGGIPYVAQQMEHYQNKYGWDRTQAKEAALRDFIAKAEESQQSSRPERLGREQTSTVGRLLLAFANTPQQYNRKIARALKDATAAGSSPEQKARAVREIIYYGAAQNLIFGGLQQAVLSALDLEDDEEKEKVGNWLNGALDTLLRGSGMIGAGISMMKNIGIAALRADKGRSIEDEALRLFVNTAPAIGSKGTHLKRVFQKKVYAQADGAWDVPSEVIRAASAANFFFNIPVDRWLYLSEQFNDLFASDLDLMDKGMRALGWSRYSIGESAGKAK